MKVKKFPFDFHLLACATFSLLLFARSVYARAYLKGIITKYTHIHTKNHPLNSLIYYRCGVIKTSSFWGHIVNCSFIYLLLWPSGSFFFLHCYVRFFVLPFAVNFVCMIWAMIVPQKNSKEITFFYGIGIEQLVHVRHCYLAI